jgi:hypothetical protein
MAVLFNDTIRCYEDGRVERLFKKKGWCEIKPTANQGEGYNLISINKKVILRHRIIASCFLGLNIDDLTQFVDHINRIRTDNRVENLRVVTRQQNQFNTAAKGYYPHRGKWQAKITLNHKTMTIGFFDTEEEAHQAYLDAKLIYHIIV